jgi:uncharacterized protein YndB with AHSA1/START domain
MALVTHIQTNGPLMSRGELRTTTANCLKKPWIFPEPLSSDPLEGTFVNPPTHTTDELVIIEYRRSFPVVAELMFAVMTEPALMTQHFGPPGVTAPIDRITVEPYVGGRFDITMINDENGEEYPNTGIIAVWEPPIRYLTSETGAAEGMTNETVFIAHEDGGTEMVMTQRNVPSMYASPEASAGMNAWFDRLYAYVLSLA